MPGGARSGADRWFHAEGDQPSRVCLGIALVAVSARCSRGQRTRPERERDTTCTDRAGASDAWTFIPHGPAQVGGVRALPCGSTASDAVAGVVALGPRQRGLRSRGFRPRSRRTQRCEGAFCTGDALEGVSGPPLGRCTSGPPAASAAVLLDDRTRTRDPYMHRLSNSRRKTVMTRSYGHPAITTAGLRQKPPVRVPAVSARRRSRSRKRRRDVVCHRPHRGSRYCRRDTGQMRSMLLWEPHTGTSPCWWVLAACSDAGGSCRRSRRREGLNPSPPRSAARGRCRADKTNPIRGRKRSPKNDVDFCDSPIFQANLNDIKRSVWRPRPAAL